MLNFSIIQSQYPKSWEDFNKFYKNEFKEYSHFKDMNPDQLPFEMLLGIFIKYFNENGVELDLCNTEYRILPAIIEDTFRAYENIISHYS